MAKNFALLSYLQFYNLVVDTYLIAKRKIKNEGISTRF